MFNVVSSHFQRNKRSIIIFPFVYGNAVETFGKIISRRKIWEFPRTHVPMRVVVTNSFDDGTSNVGVSKVSLIVPLYRFSFVRFRRRG